MDLVLSAFSSFAKKHENNDIHRMYSKVYRPMNSRKRTHYFYKSKFIQWSKTVHKNANSANSDRLPLKNYTITLSTTSIEQNSIKSPRFLSINFCSKNSKNNTPIIFDCLLSFSKSSKN